MKITEEHQEIVQEAESLAEEHLSGNDTTTQLTVWDDGDFLVEVTHGNGETREQIVYRSSDSYFYTGGEYMYQEDVVACSEEGTIKELEEINSSEA